jgi:hypothetical protein
VAAASRWPVELDGRGLGGRELGGRELGGRELGGRELGGAGTELNEMALAHSADGRWPNSS